MNKHNIPLSIKNVAQIYPKFSNVCNCGIFFLWTQERVRNGHGKQAISVQATEVLLYSENCAGRE